VAIKINVYALSCIFVLRRQIYNYPSIISIWNKRYFTAQRKMSIDISRMRYTWRISSTNL